MLLFNNTFQLVKFCFSNPAVTRSNFLINIFYFCTFMGKMKSYLQSRELRNEFKKNPNSIIAFIFENLRFFKLMIMPDTQSFIIMYILPGNYSIVCIGFHPNPSKTSSSLSCQAPLPPSPHHLKSVNSPSPPF